MMELALRHRTHRYACQWTRKSSELLGRVSDSSRASSIAVTDTANHVHSTYGDLSRASTALASVLYRNLPQDQGTVGAFNKSSHSFVVAMLAAWRLGKTFVPLCVTHSVNELSYIARDSKLSGVVCSALRDVPAGFAEALSMPMIATDEIDLYSENVTVNLPAVPSDPDRDALVIYTSGTTGRPKGVVHSAGGVTAMIRSLVQAWQYSERDRILHFLPLYHVHGLLNKLVCVLWVGGQVDFLESAKAEVIWARLADEQSSKSRGRPLSLFMGVPTIYARMLEAARSLSPQQLALALQTVRRMRLTACGSAALPDSVMDAWRELTGHVLLERYGMTELGMALTNPYVPADSRRKGSVGQPFPSVQCRLVDDDELEVTAHSTPGELRVKGPTVFRRYLNLPAVTAESFDTQGWFRTGDIAQVSEDGFYKILGRNSTDIIKSSGYKLSALEIERELLSHPQVLEAAVVGAVDEVVGERIVAVLVLREVQIAADSACAPTMDLLACRASRSDVEQRVRLFLADRLAHYKHPKEVLIVGSIPRNHLGKVNKKSLLKELAGLR